MVSILFSSFFKTGSYGLLVLDWPVGFGPIIFVLIFENVIGFFKFLIIFGGDRQAFCTFDRHT